MVSVSLLQSRESKNWKWAGIFLLVSTLLGLLCLKVPVYFVMGGLVLMAIMAYLAFHPDKVFYLAIFTIPFTDRVRLLPISFSLNDLIILYAAFLCVTHAILRSHRVSLRTSLDVWIVVLTVMYFLAGFFSENTTGLLGFSKVFEAFIVYYMTVYLIRTKQITRARVIRTLIFTTLAQASLGIFQSVTSIGSDFDSNRGYLGYLGLGSSHVWHGRGTTWHFNTLGNYLTANLLIFLPLYYFCIKQKRKALVLAGIIMLGIITTYSRGSLLGFIAGFVYFLAVSQPSWKRSVLFVAAFLGLVVWPAFNFLNNTSYAETVSYEERLIVWQVPLAAITSSAKAFWLGSGLNSYAVVAWPFIPAWVPPDQFRNWFAHNFYLLTMIEVGLVGAIILFSFLGYIWIDTWIKFRKCHGWTSYYSLALSVSVVVIFFVSIFDHTFASPHFKVFIFLLLGLLYVKRDPPVKREV